MREVDRGWNKALAFFADNNRARAMHMKENDNEFYKRRVTQGWWGIK